MIGHEACFRNVVLFATTHASASFDSLATLKVAYIGALKQVQPSVPTEVTTQPVVVTDPVRELDLMRLYQLESRLNDKDQQRIFAERQLPDEARTQRLAALSSRIEIFREAHPGFFRLFDLAINQIICPGSDRAGGGSTSAGVGIIWVNEKPHWTQRDILELLIHELTYNLMFLDELCFGHYRDYELMTRPEAFAQSAILRQRRPLDKAFHSLIVAVEVLLARGAMPLPPGEPRLHPTNDRLRQQALESAASIGALDERTEILTDRGRALLGKACRLLARLLA